MEPAQLSQGQQPRSSKIPKVTHGNEGDYSNSVRKKLSSSTRTGQACDRCKVRKIRCDSTAGGCTPCRQAQTTCKTTDRITGKATTRGHTDVLETENRYLKSKVLEYHQKLSDLGVPLADLQIVASNASSASASRGGSQQYWDPNGSPQHDGDERAGSVPVSMEPSLFQRHLDSHSGGLLPNPGFTMLRGTKLSLFGMQIDVGEFAEDAADFDSPKTFEGFIQYAFNRAAPVEPAPLPPTLQNAKEYANWYFAFLNPYTPVLDKRDMHELLTKIYSDISPGPRPGRTAAEEVLLHMMFAQIKYQYGQRNHLQQTIDEGMGHFKYSLRFFPDLVRGQTLQDIQALVLITLQVRGFPQPGAAWYCGQLALSAAVEMGLNRSADAWSAIEQRHMDAHEMEMRKRVFWTLYGLVLGLSGRLGRPMPVRLTDIDIELPAPVPDHLPEETNLPEFRKCSFHVGIGVLTMLAMCSDLYSTFYSVSAASPHDYDTNVARLEADLRTWRSRLHPDLTDSSRAEGEVQIYALYLELYDLEFQFLLRHPLIFPPNQPERYKENLRHSREIAPKTLAILKKLSDAKCLDVPWYNVSVFLAMVFTTLFAEDQRQDEMTMAELHKLKADMDLWVSVMGDIGAMLGSGSRLQNSVSQIIHNVLDTLSGRITAKAAAAVAAEALNHSQPGSSGADAYSSNHNYPSADGAHSVPAEIKTEPASVYPAPDANNIASAISPYPPSGAQPTYSVYGGGVATPQAAYQSNQNPYAQGAYGVSAAEQVPTAQTATPLAVPSVQTSQAAAAMYGAPYYAAQDAQTTPANEWLRWSQANLNPFAHSVQPEYMTSATANTLMTLGARNPVVQNSAQAGTAVQEAGSQWPLNLYTLGPQGGNPPS